MANEEKPKDIRPLPKLEYYRAPRPLYPFWLETLHLWASGAGMVLFGLGFLIACLFRNPTDRFDYFAGGILLLTAGCCILVW